MLDLVVEYDLNLKQVLEVLDRDPPLERVMLVQCKQLIPDIIGLALTQYIGLSFLGSQLLQFRLRLLLPGRNGLAGALFECWFFGSEHAFSPFFKNYVIIISRIN